MKLFKKKQEVKSEMVNEKKYSYLDFLVSFGKKLGYHDEQAELNEKFNKLFPRTINDIVPVNYSKDGKLVAMDNDLPYQAKFYNEIEPNIMKFLNQTFIGYQACALLKQNPFIDRACSIPAKDAIAPDYKISYLKKEDQELDDSTADIDELSLIKDESYRKYHINAVCAQQTTNKKVFGYSIVVPIVDGVDMEKPFNIDGIKPGSYHGMKVVEPYWITPQLDYDGASNPASAHFYEPTWYAIGGKKIHHTWVIKAVNSEVSDTLKPTYYFGGIPLTQQIYERVYAADKVANEAPMLALTKRLLIIDADIANMVANPEDVTPVLRALTELRDNYGVYAKNPEDQVQQIDTSLSDFDALIMTQYQLVASIAGMPATKLLKTTPKGFNATGEYEEHDYKQALLEIQENDYIPIINRHNDLYTKSKFGRVIPLDVKFNPIDTPSEKEVAEISSIKSQVAMNHINAGITTAEEERDVLRLEEGSPYSSLPAEMPESDFNMGGINEEENVYNF